MPGKAPCVSEIGSMKVLVSAHGDKGSFSRPRKACALELNAHLFVAVRPGLTCMFRWLAQSLHTAPCVLPTATDASLCLSHIPLHACFSFRCKAL